VAYGAVGLFVMVGLAILYWFLKALLSYQRFRGVVLVLDPHPARADGDLAGTVSIPVPYSAANVYRAKVTASEHSAHRSGGKLHTRTQLLFEEEAVVRAEPAAGGTRLRFSIALPPEAPASMHHGESLAWSSSTIDKVYLHWRVHFEADIPGVDLDESFEVPVVRGAAPAAMPRTAAADIAPARVRMVDMGPALVGAAPAVSATPVPRPASSKPPPLPAGHNPAYQYQRVGERIRVVQPAWKKPGNVGSIWNLIGGLVPSGAFVAVGVYLLGQGVWWGIFFLIVGAIFVIGVPAWLGHELAAEIDAEMVRITRRIGPLVFKDVRLYRAQIAEIEAAAESQAQQVGSSLSRSVRVRMRDGSVHNLAEFMQRQHEAVVLRNLVAARLGLGADARTGSARVAESARRPALAPDAVLAPGEVPAPSTTWVKVVGGLVVAGVFVWQAWPFAREFLFPQRQRPQPTTAAQPAAPVQRQALPAPGSWNEALEQGRTALAERRPADAERLFREALGFVEKQHGAEHPAAGLVLHQLALAYEGQKRAGDQEATLKRSLAVFERTAPREAKAQLGALGNFVDKENVARYLGDMYWDQRRYADSFVYYQRAHAAALEVDVVPSVRNVKRAYTSAGVMKTACMAGQWDLADETMAELKERYPTVGPEVQRYLKYWIDTGEPRLKARKC
jgi:tetratricopeptide (TPR) repeat protein